MVKKAWYIICEWASAIGGDIYEPDLRTQKMVLVVLSLSAIPLGLIWTLIEFANGDPRNGLVSASIASLILLNLLIYAFSKNFVWYRTTQLAIFLLFPVVLHFTAGGYTMSANLMWSLGAPLIALLSSRPRDGLPWFAGYVIIVAVAGIVDPLVFPEASLSISAVFSEFSMNIINISIIVYLMLIYFVRRKNQAIELLNAEKDTSQSLLLNILPKEIAPRLMDGTPNIADSYEQASVLFADIVGFTVLSRQLAPEQMVELLDETFSYFDMLVERYGLEKIRTIGDNYMVASGVPRPREDHAKAIANLALDMMDYINAPPSKDCGNLRFRIGMNSGPVVAGVIGRHKFQYDLWGDPVNTASRMESHGLPGKIQITQEMYELIKDDFVCVPRGIVDVKGKGVMETWFLTGRK